MFISFDPFGSQVGWDWDEVGGETSFCMHVFMFVESDY